MLSTKLINRYKLIINEAVIMVSKNVDKNDLTGVINYAAVYSHSQKEFEQITKELKKNGNVSDAQPTGDYYLLSTPLKTDYGTIKNCRVRKPDNEHPQKGYIDFEVKDYQRFKGKYINKKNFSVIHNVHDIELTELKDPDFEVCVYFPKDFY